jgi:hypothetical protein
VKDAEDMLDRNDGGVDHRGHSNQMRNGEAEKGPDDGKRVREGASNVGRAEGLENCKGSVTTTLELLAALMRRCERVPDAIVGCEYWRGGVENGIVEVER